MRVIHVSKFHDTYCEPLGQEFCAGSSADNLTLTKHTLVVYATAQSIRQKTPCGVTSDKFLEMIYSVQLYS